MTYKEQLENNNNGLNKLDYNYIKPGQPIPSKGGFRIQASAISRFFDQTNQFYREKLLGETPAFLTSTSAVCGSCIHWAAENYVKDNLQLSQEAKDEMYAYIDEQSAKFPDLVDPSQCREIITPMWRSLREFLQLNPGGLVEPFLEVEILPGITTGGSIDRLYIPGDTTIYTSLEQLSGKTVIIQDWKTTSTKYASDKSITQSAMSKNYEWQLLVYAYVLKKAYNINVSAIQDIFITREYEGEISEKTGKRGKAYPSMVVPITKPVTPESLEFIESIINIVAHSVQSFVLNPGPQRGMLSQDWRLINHTAELPFPAITASKVEEEI